MKVRLRVDLPYEKGLESRCLFAGDMYGNAVCEWNRLAQDGVTHRCALFRENLPGPYHKCAACRSVIESLLRAKKQKGERRGRLWFLIYCGKCWRGREV